jgi:hypothetical protein
MQASKEQNKCQTYTLTHACAHKRLSLTLILVRGKTQVHTGVVVHNSVTFSNPLGYWAANATCAL